MRKVIRRFTQHVLESVVVSLWHRLKEDADMQGNRGPLRRYHIAGAIWFVNGPARHIGSQSPPPAPREGLAQDDLAYEAEVSRSYLSQLEKGAFYASLKILQKLAKALGVEPFELIAPPPKRRR
jgi:DNA-binding XRE family transcriptional regulator